MYFNVKLRSLMSGMIRVCFFYLLMWMSGTIWGQATRMYVPSLSFTKRDGLTQNQVVNLVEDNLGRVWIGTQNGISVFDGSRVKSFHPDQLRLDGAVKYLNVDGEGRLWGATNSHLFSFDGIRTQVVELTSPYGSGVTFYLSPDGEPALAAQEGDQVLRNGRLIPLTDAYPWLQCTGPVRELRQFGRNDLCFYLVGRDSLQIYDSGRKLLGNVSLRENGCHYEPVVLSFDAIASAGLFNVTIVKNVADFLAPALKGLGTNLTIYNAIIINPGDAEMVLVSQSNLTVEGTNIDDGAISQQPTNQNLDPYFYEPAVVTTSTWTAVTYDANSGLTTLVSATMTWEPDAFVGKFVQPDTNSPRVLHVIGNDTTSIRVMGDWSGQVKVGAAFQLLTVDPTVLSPGIDLGVSDAAPDKDYYNTDWTDSPGGGTFYDQGATDYKAP